MTVFFQVFWKFFKFPQQFFFAIPLNFDNLSNFSAQFFQIPKFLRTFLQYWNGIVDSLWGSMLQKHFKVSANFFLNFYTTFSKFFQKSIPAFLQRFRNLYLKHCLKNFFKFCWLKLHLSSARFAQFFTKLS